MSGGLPQRLRSGLALALDPIAGPVPAARFLSDGSFTVLITAAGTGCTAQDGVALTRWRGDRVEDPDGFFIYLRDLDSGGFWSASHQPIPGATSRYETRWRPGCFEIVRLDDGIESRLEIAVPPDAGVEIRRLTLRNRSSRRRRIELTSCAEVVLNDSMAHAAHPAFSRLFVQTEFVLPERALLAWRRPRAAGEHFPWMVHAVRGGDAVEWETDRARFLGRGARPGAPRALVARTPLAGSTGSVLDPVVCLRCRLDLAAGEDGRIVFLLGAAPGRQQALALVARFTADAELQRAFEQAEAHAQAELARLELSVPEAEYFQMLAGAMLYGHPGLRADPGILERAASGAQDLVRLGLSPQRALAVVRADASAGAAHVATLHRAHRYWQSLGLPIDLVVLRGHPPYDLDTAGGGPALLDGEALSDTQVELLEASARLVVTDSLPPPGASAVGAAAVGATGRDAGKRDTGERGAAGHHTTLDTGERVTSGGVSAEPGAGPRPGHPGGKVPPEPVLFFNGYGGFTADGSEYVICMPWKDAALLLPPRPWINIVANERFGFLLSDTGAGYTWSDNSREHRLTPWYNDPVLDPHGEAFYVRDEENGDFWSILPGPSPGRGDYEMRHGFGYSQCRHSSHGLEQQTLLFVPRRDRVKITRLRVENTSGRRRRISLCAYYRLVLGRGPEESAPFVVTELEARSRAVFARHRFAGEFAAGVVFAAAIGSGATGEVCCSGDREAFIGRNRSPTAPAALRRQGPLDGRTGAGLDPCIAQQVTLELSPGESHEVCFLFGAACDEVAAGAVVADCTQPGAIDRALDEVQRFWHDLISGIRISTPSPALDLMVNGWLPYQVLACRIWGRSAFYQSGGAFGFRDQLQDAAALIHLWPEATRAQLLLHAAHQFVEGDVLHWWHPPAGRGIRTRFADDLLWLPCLTAYYVRTTGDWSVLDEEAPFLAARALEPGEDEAFLVPERSGQRGDLYQHCCRALDRSLGVGRHGLPFFGTGDWNDGMNRVGRQGRGESVWMGFFLYFVLGEFVPVCERRRDTARVERYLAHREALRAALNAGGWDGGWYRRGYYDDGTPLGSRLSDECRIDALVQAWAVISGAAPPERAAQAMDAVERHLIDDADGLIRLLLPPFDRTPHDPGYIKGYVPGVRENGGQYTHAALWVVRAMAELGRHERASQLLDMLNPVHHARTAEAAATYQVEPYVVAADVYGEPPHVGRGGWTWYTGSAGWMYRVALESLLGFRFENGDTLVMAPRVPDAWPEFSIGYELPGEPTRYEIRVRNPERRAQAVVVASFDGEPARVEGGAARIPLAHDGKLHRVDVVLGPREGNRS